MRITLKTADRLDLMDRRLLEKAQNSFPLTVRPWRSIGNELSISEKEVIARLNRLSKQGFIRKIGPALNAVQTDLRASTLVAMKLHEDRIQGVAKMIGEHRGVTHCYQREHEYNLWFTIAARNQPELEKTLEAIKHAAGVTKDELLNLPSIRTFKIDVRFRLS